MSPVLCRSQGVQGKNRRKMPGKSWGDSHHLLSQSPAPYNGTHMPEPDGSCAPSCSRLDRIPPLSMSSLFSCQTWMASGFGVPPGMHSHIGSKRSRRWKASSFPDTCSHSWKGCSLLDRGTGHAPLDPMWSGPFSAQAQAAPALVFTSPLPSSFLTPRQPCAHVTALTFTITCCSRKLPSERVLFSLYSHLIHRPAGREERQGNSLDLG